MPTVGEAVPGRLQEVEPPEGEEQDEAGRRDDDERGTELSYLDSGADSDTGGQDAPVLFQPMAGDDVADEVARVAIGEPLNGRVDTAGSEQYRMDDFFRQALSDDQREVVTDEHAQYFGAELTETSLVPEGDATLGRIRYEDWSRQ